jgi:rhomboid protease GluP
MQRDGPATPRGPEGPSALAEKVPPTLAEKQTSARPVKQSLVETVRRAPTATLIVAINLIVFVLAERTGRTTSPDTLLRFGAVWRVRVWQGEYWRLVTSMFLHIGVLHLAWNSYYGFRISAQVERAIGSGRFLVLYVLSGIAGSALSVIGHDAVSAGASGALFGLIGWQLVILRSRMGSLRAMWADPGVRSNLTWIGGWFVLGAFAGFDNYAHAGGLLFGLLFTQALIARPPRRKARLAAPVLAFAAIVALSLRPLPVLHPEEYAWWKAAHSKQ